jgi:DNA-directed RNA polymerase II subunit RPB1
MGDNIIGVQFGIANPDEIISRSVVELVTDKTHQQGGLPAPGGVFDSRFGVIENGKICPTCKSTNLQCPGHFGHIKLARPVYLYQFLDYVRKVLTVVCLSCSNPYLKDEDLEGLAKIGGLAKVKEVTAHTKYVKLGCPHCQTASIKSVDKIDGTVATLEAWTWDPNQEKGILLQTELVLRCFQRITDKHVDMIGLHSRFSRPDWMICTVLAVPPLTVRPSVVMEDNQRMEDDLTHKLITIVRNNQRLKEKIDSSGTGGPVTSESLDMIAKCTELLQFDVATYVDNEIKGIPPSAQRSGRPLKTLRSRLGTKNGRVRGNLMGKRVDFSARSVITPDPNIDLDQLGVPKEIAMNLTFPEIVTEYNRDRLSTFVRNGSLSYPGAKSVYIKSEDKTFSLKFVNPETLNLREGDIVNRHLIDGDVVLFNRQPSLHKASMECHRIIVLPYSTFRLNVSATRPYNADFDGDEMNMHVPQSIVAATEIKYLASVLRQIVSPRTHSPIIQIFQDTGTGAYRLTQPNVRVPEHIAMNILARMKKPLSSYERSKDGYVDGATLMSSTFPLLSVNAGVTIKDGVLQKGVMGKDAFGKASEGLVHVIYNDFGPTRTGQFINDVQNVVTKYNLFAGFSVGSSDLVANEETSSLIASKLAEGRRGVNNILSAVHSGSFVNMSGRSDGDELESQIVKTLKEIGSAIGEQVISSLKDDNRMKQMVASKTKGSDLNITQMMALLGQQLVSGKRIQYTLQDRTLPHFNRFDDGIESRGFVENSFISGIRPTEFFFHAQGGREGLIDTAVKTSDSGYIQRKLVKTLEDLRVMYDGTVRNSLGAVIQFRYAGDGADSITIENQSIQLGVMPMETLYKEFARL